MCGKGAMMLGSQDQLTAIWENWDQQEVLESPWYLGLSSCRYTTAAKLISMTSADQSSPKDLVDGYSHWEMVPVECSVRDYSILQIYSVSAKLLGLKHIHYDFQVFLKRKNI